jgi:hypothetical protein
MTTAQKCISLGAGELSGVNVPLLKKRVGLSRKFHVAPRGENASSTCLIRTGTIFFCSPLQSVAEN